jgi:catechol 2,3-dioxygenase-like lactoylglutathione lyase family enzyme
MIELCVDAPGFAPNAEVARELWLAEKPTTTPSVSGAAWGLRAMMSAWDAGALPPTKVPAFDSSSTSGTAGPSVGFHHLSFTTKDTAATRHFYEDLFGFPLVHCDVEHCGDSWIKCAFFDVGRGSYIAFQSFENIGECGVWHTGFDRFPNMPSWANHAAFRATFEQVKSVRARMEKEGIKPLMEMGHGWCYSLYYMDPNGIPVELCVDTPGYTPDRAEAVRLWEGLD